MHNIRAPSRRHHHRSFLLLSVLLSTFILTPRVDAQEPANQQVPEAVATLDRLAAPPATPGLPATRSTNGTQRPTTNNPRPTITTDPVITIPTATTPVVITTTTTTTTTTIRTFSDNIITVGGSATTKSTSQTTVSVQQPSETPYGYVSTDDTNGGVMLTVSLVVVFVVLSAMGIVVFCLFKRRNAKHRMGLFGRTPSNNGSSGGLGDFMSPGEGKKRESIRGASASEMDLNRESLQEMSEHHQNALMTRRSSTLSLGSLQQTPVNRGSMLSPSLSARPTSIGSNHWGGSMHGPQSAHNSMVIGNDHLSPRSSEFRNSQYDGYYGPPQASYMYPSGGSGNGSSNSINYSSNEQLLQYPHAPFTHHNGSSGANMSRRSSLSPGLYPSQPTTESGRNSPVARSKTISVAHSSGAYAQPQQQQQYYSQQPYHNSPYHSQPISVPAPIHQQPTRGNSAPIPTIVSVSTEELSGESNITTTTDSAQEGTSSTSATYESTEEQKRSLTAVGSGASNSNPNVEHGSRPQSMSALPGSGVGARMGMPPHDDIAQRPQSMMSHQHHHHLSPSSSSPANLVIPPSITTRRRSQMNNPNVNTNSMYSDHSMGRPQSPPMHGYYTNPHTVYYHQPPPPSTASSGSGSRRDSQPLDQITYEEVVVEIKEGH
ncbi:hypothetical protein MVEG_04124 [Podila verticillata NRRL 6337]|nr:hypothetical protein MVEG_04124 [Podila verticillata NRRL 6337]